MLVYSKSRDWLEMDDILQTLTEVLELNSNWVRLTYNWTNLGPKSDLKKVSRQNVTEI